MSVERITPKYTQVAPSNVESRTSGGTADVLPAERARATFEVEKMTNVLDGGPEKTKRRRFIISPGEGVDLSHKYFLDRAGLLKEHVKHFIGVHQDFWDSFVPTREDVSSMMEYSAFSGALMNHYGLFLPTILSSASNEQKAMWMMPAWQMKIIGCYAQTELGHGSNVRGLMTTAEYDKKTQEFVLNTPTLRSIKWWPGALGKAATHAVVYAQLIIDGKEYGVHAFMVQIRDVNHKPIPGVEVGDLGPKLGDGANDTGFMRLDNVRIPREFMLAAHQQVTPEGQYVKSERKQKNDKLHYATMMNARGAMVKGAGGALAKAVTVAVRYSCVRRQGFTNTKNNSYKAEERKIIDYQVQRYRLLKQLATAYAFKFTGKWMMNAFAEFEGTDSKGMGSNENVNLDALPFIAATSAGLKALCTVVAWTGIEDCRKCCGGNGYLLNSGVASLAADYVWQTTAEGDFVILTLQTARFLIKSLNNAIKGEVVAGPIDYLSAVRDPNFNLAKVSPPAAKSPKDFQDLAYLVNLYKYLALVSVVRAGEDLKARLAKESGNFDEAWNSLSVELMNCVKAHSFYFILTNFANTVNNTEEKACKAALAKLCALFACCFILDEGMWIGVLSAEHLRLVKLATVELMEQIRPDSVALVDAFDIPDRILNSTIGRYDGNIYEALYESAIKSPLNQTEPFVGYEEVLRPTLDLELLKQGNRLPDSKM